MTKLDNLHALFQHELEDIYDAELKLVDALKSQAADSATPEIRDAFQTHQKETVGQVRRLEQVFEAFGKEPSRGKGCAGIDGLLEERKEFKREEPSPQILDVFSLAAATKVERYEITAYEGLVRLAEKMGLDDAVRLLEDNLKEEQTTLEKVTRLAKAEGRLQGVAARAR